VSEAKKEFIDFYRRHRLQDQLTYYRARRDEFEVAQLQGTWLAGVVMVLASACALLGASGVGPRPAVWKILAAALPALSATILAFLRLYAFERLAKLYGDAAAALADVVRRPTGNTDHELEAAIQAHVAKVERIFVREQGQWGQLIADLDSPQQKAEENADRGGGGEQQER
jgi:SMODS and SLOG-associating 2TM effector domain 1